MSGLPSPVRSPGPATLHPKSSLAVSPSIRQKSVSAAAGSGPDRFWPVTTHTCPTVVLAFTSDNAISSRAGTAGVGFVGLVPNSPMTATDRPSAWFATVPRNWLMVTICVVDTTVGGITL